MRYTSVSKRLLPFRTQILFGFSAFLLVIIFWIALFFRNEKRRDDWMDFKAALQSSQQSYLEKSYRLQNSLLIGYRQPEFYLDRSEANIQSFLNNQRSLYNALENLRQDALRRGLGLDSAFLNLIEANAVLADSVRLMRELQYEKGYKDYGLIGKMREKAHWLEDSSSMALADILQLRRHEKDFLMRGEEQYVQKFENKIGQLLGQPALAEETATNLIAYRAHFLAVVQKENELGIRANSGLYAHILGLIESINFAYDQLGSNLDAIMAQSLKRLRLLFYLQSFLLLLLAIALSIFLAQRLTRDLAYLNQRVMGYIESGFTQPNNPDFQPRSRELSLLNRSFQELKTRLSENMLALQQQKDQAEKNAAYKALFLANMSHEIRTPLNGVTGMLHLLQSTDLSSQQRNFLETAQHAAEHLLKLVDMILDYSKIDARKMKVEALPLALEQELQKLLPVFRFKAEEKNLDLRLETNLKPGCDLVLGDSLRIQQVLINLLNNAIKFTDAGEVVLRLDCQKEGSQVKCTFTVKDTGIGIVAEEVDRLFQAFEQQETSTTRTHGGTGLGLSISQKLVELMGGKLEVESQPGRGSRFWFTLWLEPASSRSAWDVKRDEGNGRPHQLQRILVVEDNPVNQKVLALTLQQKGMVVDLAENGKVALQRFVEAPYDLVLMDLRMPVMDGFEATRAIQASEAYQQRPVPIVAVTANAFEEDRQEALQAGMDDFLAKPIKPQALQALLGKFAPTQNA